MASDDTSTPTWPRVLGIVGGLGPHAHVELERRLLAAVTGATRDQDYPPWIVSSLPATPDRTRAFYGEGPSPAPLLVASLENLADRADFAVIACITAHAFLDEVRPRSPLPILDLVESTLSEATGRWGDDARVGVLATTGTLQSRLFQRVAERRTPGVSVVSLLDLPEGEHLQEECVMTPIYGPLQEGERSGGGLKTGTAADPRTGTPHTELLRRAVTHLADAGADVILTACTEIGMALGGDAATPSEPALLDPLDVAVSEALAISRGDRPLP